ncbi:HNH endonuclease signature motif containing protein [Gordonia iterans]
MSNRAHRVSWELKNGPVPEGLVLDHLCRNRACVRPDHMEPVPNRTNVLRGEGVSAAFASRTHCSYGHKLPDGPAGQSGRVCQGCVDRRYRERLERHRRERAAVQCGHMTRDHTPCTRRISVGSRCPYQRRE